MRSTSVDFTSKPYVKLDLDAQRLDLAAISAAEPRNDSGDPAAEWDKPWGDAALNLDALNFVDAELQFSAAELTGLYKTLFQPERSALAEITHPLIVAYLRAAVAR